MFDLCINITLDGYVDHKEGIADDESAHSSPPS